MIFSGLDAGREPGVLLRDQRALRGRLDDLAQAVEMLAGDQLVGVRRHRDLELLPGVGHLEDAVAQLDAQPGAQVAVGLRARREAALSGLRSLRSRGTGLEQLARHCRCARRLQQCPSRRCHDDLRKDRHKATICDVCPEAGGSQDQWRRRQDSNLRALSGQWFSRPPPSASRPLLRAVNRQFTRDSLGGEALRNHSATNHAIGAGLSGSTLAGLGARERRYCF